MNISTIIHELRPAEYTMKCRHLPPAVLLLGMLAAAPTTAQSLGTVTGIATTPTAGSVTGMIVDEHGRPLSGATIRLAGTTQGAISRASGRFFIANVGAGDYVANITCHCFIPYRTTITVSAGQVTILNAAMKLDTSCPHDTLARTEKTRGNGRGPSSNNRATPEQSSRVSIQAVVGLQDPTPFTIRGRRGADTAIRTGTPDINDPVVGGFGMPACISASAITAVDVPILPNSFAPESGEILSGVVNNCEIRSLLAARETERAARNATARERPMY
ncbi:MAG: carboxypeptidase regulatory-like domain-containing protein [Bacteroidetes bacterium]|nr:carboxypeptidase regulatory-like domain-containing protein [Bacteroidota bacterium]